jgi:CHAT domain-containing protein
VRERVGGEGFLPTAHPPALLPNLSVTVNPPEVEIDPGVFALDEYFTHKFEAYLGISVEFPSPSLQQIREVLRRIEGETGVRPALNYVTFLPEGQALNPPSDIESQLQGNRKTSSDSLSMVLVTAEGVPVQKRISVATRARVQAMAQQLREDLTNPIKRRSTSYLEPAQQLYQWLVAPLEADLKARGIQNLVMIVDVGLRSLPFAALHDGQQFLVEKYSLGLMPSINLTDTRYESIKDMQVLAMGASVFYEQKPLPAVPVELTAVAQELWRGELFLNEAFTLDNLKSQRARTPFGIIHLATHAEFQAGAAGKAYIQLWDTKLRLEQVRQLGWYNPKVELLVLSACRTALGDEGAELGFAGLAVQTGVKSAIASLWSVSDQGTLGLMREFYQSLKAVPIKSEALRQAQIAMLNKRVRLQDGHLVSSAGNVTLPADLVQMGSPDLSHPYYWAGFTMIGSPW